MKSELDPPRSSSYSKRTIVTKINFSGTISIEYPQIPSSRLLTSMKPNHSSRRCRSQLLESKVTPISSREMKKKLTESNVDTKQLRAKINFKELLLLRLRSTIKKILIKSLIPHFCATFLLMLLVGVRNNLISEACFLDNVVCRNCSMGVKIFYMGPISLEYLIPILYGYYISFYSNKIPNFLRMSYFYMTVSYATLFALFYFWDSSFYRFFPEKTLDNFVYASLFVINSIIILPLLKRYTSLSWITLVLKTKYNTIMLVMGFSAFILFINILHWFQEALKKHGDDTLQNLYQIFLTIFCISYETSLLYIMVKRHPALVEDWQNNKSPLLFIAKNILIFSYAIRLANMAVLDASQFGFYLQLVTYVQYNIEMLSGKSFFEFIIRKIREKFRNKSKFRLKIIEMGKKDEEKDNIICLRIMSYQKIEFALIYFPRTLYLILFNKWSLSQPFNKLVEGCTFKINERIKISGGNLIMMMVIDVALTLIFFRKMINSHKLLHYVKFEVEKISFAYKVLLYMAFQICYEYWFHYYMNMIYV